MKKSFLMISVLGFALHYSQYKTPNTPKQVEAKQMVNTSTEDADALYRKAYQEYRQNKYDAALEFINKALDLDKNNVEFYSLKAYIYIKKKDYNASIKVIDEAMVRFPKNASLYELKANGLSVTQRKKEALPYYEKMLALEQNNGRYYYNYLDTLAELRDFDKIVEVFEIYQKALEKNSNMKDMGELEDEIYFYPSLAYYQKGNKKKSIELLNKVIEIEPNYNGYFINRGNAYSDLKDYTAALADYNKAIAINDQNGDSYYNRGSVYLDLKQYKEAIKDFNTAEKLGYTYGGLYQNRSNAYKALKDYDKALTDLQKAIELQPNNTQLNNNLAVLYQKLGKENEAKKEFEKADNGYNSHISLYNQASNANKKQDYATAIQLLNKAIERKKDFVDAYNLLGLIYSKTKDYKMALETFTSGLQYDEKNAEIYNNRGHVYKNMNNTDAAQEDYLAALKHNPSMIVEYYNLAKMYMQNDQKNLAQQYYDLATNSQLDIPEYFIDFTSFLMKTQQAERAIQIGEQGAKKHPENYDILINLAGAYLDAKQYEKNAQTLQKAIKLDPEKFDAYYNLGNHYFTIKKDYPNAEKNYLLAISKEMPSQEAYLNLASVYQDMAKDDKMLDIMNLLIKKYPKSYETYYNRAEYYYKKGKTKEAIADFEKSFELMDSEVIQAEDNTYQINIERSSKSLLKAQAYQMMGMYQEAIPAFQQYLAFHTKDGGAYNNYAYCLLEVGKPNDALNFFNKAYQLQPEEIDTLVGLIATNYLMRNTQQVKKLKTLAEEKFPQYNINENLLNHLVTQGYFYSEKFISVWNNALKK